MNEVRIQVTSDDATSPGFASAKRQAKSFGDSVSQMFRGLAGIGVAAAADLATSFAGPLVAAAGATTAAFASAGAALGAFGLAAAGQVGDITSAADAHKKLQEAIAQHGKGSAEAKAATEEFERAMAGMPGPTREAAQALLDLKSNFNDWSDSLAGDTMPVFTKGLNLASSILPSLTPLVKAGASALSGFMDTLQRDAQSGGFAKFIKQLADAARSVLPSFLRSLRNVAIGFGGVISAFLPFSDDMAGGLEDLTAKFAEFGRGLSENEGFQNWMADVSDQAPDILDLLGDLVRIVLNVAEAMAPFTGATLKVTAALADFVAAIPQDVMNVLAPTITGIVLAIKAWSIAQGVLNVVLAANPIGVVVIALAALVGGLIYAYKNSETFREIVDQAFSIVKEKGVELWEKIRPGLQKMADLIGQTLPEAAAFLAEALSELAGQARTVAEEILGINGSLEETPESGAGVIEWFKENWEPVIGGIILGPLGGIIGAVEDKFGSMGEAFTTGGEFLREKWLEIWEGINRIAVNGARRMLRSVHRNVGETIHHLLSPWPGAQKLFDRFWAGLAARARSGANRIASAAGSLTRRIASLRPSWSGLWRGLVSAGSRVVGMLRGILNRARSIGSQISNVIGGIPFFASGGISHAAEGGPRGNLAMVGEHGRELVRLPFGSTVIPNGQTENMMAAAGGGGVARLEWGRGPSDPLSRAVWEWLKANVRIEGGGGDDSVQRALGGG